MRSRLIATLLFLASTTVFADGPTIVTCRSTDPRIDALVQETIGNGSDPNYSTIVFQVNGTNYKFAGAQIRKYNQYPHSAKIKMLAMAFIYYIPTDEFENGTPPFHGRIIVIKPRLTPGSISTPAACTVDTGQQQ